MSRTINKVELLGRVGTDPEMQYTPNGTAVTKLRLATDRRRQDGEVEADWHNVVIWSKSAEAVNEYIGKGDRIYVAGRLVNNTWEGDPSTGSGQAGQRRYRTEIHASEVVFLDSSQRQRRTAGRSTAATPRTSRRRSPPLPSSPLSPQPHSDASLKAHHGAAPNLQGAAPLLFLTENEGGRHDQEEDPHQGRRAA